MKLNQNDPSFQNLLIEFDRAIDQTGEKMFGDMNAHKKNATKRIAAMLLVLVLFFTGPVFALPILFFTFLRAYAKKASQQQSQDPAARQDANFESHAQNRPQKPSVSASNRERDRTSALTGERKRESASIRQQKREDGQTTALPLVGLEKQLAQLEAFYKNGLMEKEEYLQKRRKLLRGR